MDESRLKVLITGATGMVGRGILQECLVNPQIESVVIINRSSTGITHPKLKEVIHKDFFDLESIQDVFTNIDACFYALGVSSVGLDDDLYKKMIVDLTDNFAKSLYKNSPNAVFNFISGKGSDSSETSSTMWKRVKGRAENLVLGYGFKDAYAFRPGLIKPEKDTPRKTIAYKILVPVVGVLFPLIVKLFPNAGSTIQQIAKAMIYLTYNQQDQKVIELKDINALAKK